MSFIKRNFSTRPKVSLVHGVLKSVTNNEYKPRKHPGIIPAKTISLPEIFITAMEKVLGDYPVKSLLKSAESMNRYLKCRQLPIEKENLKNITEKAQKDALASLKNNEINHEDEKKLKQSLNDRTKKFLKQRVYNWQPIKFDIYNSLTYMLARSAQEYAVLVKIMSEIALRDPKFKPQSLFDFGSGLGIGTWAAISFWKNSIFEYFNVDISRDMNDLAQTLLKNGSTTGKSVVEGVFYRQFLPTSRDSYDLVISSYSLLELPSAQSRMETILKLWNKTQNYLIIVEHGTQGGFQIVNEIRDFILHLNDGNSGGHVFSPCPHDHICPKIIQLMPNKCTFPVKYTALSFSNKCEVHHEIFSYVVLKKGHRDVKLNWPRLVQPTLVRSKHCICRMCNSHGNLKEIIFSASKHGQALYYCAKKTQWGDLLPIQVDEETNSSINCDKL